MQQQTEKQTGKVSAWWSNRQPSEKQY